MRKKSFRKHLRKLTTDAERQEAKAERVKQTARKQQLIADYMASQKKARKVGNSEILVKKMAEGAQQPQSAHCTMSAGLHHKLARHIAAPAAACCINRFS